MTRAMKPVRLRGMVMALMVMMSRTGTAPVVSSVAKGITPAMANRSAAKMLVQSVATKVHR